MRDARLAIPPASGPVLTETKGAGGGDRIPPNVGITLGEGDYLPFTTQRPCSVRESVQNMVNLTKTELYSVSEVKQGTKNQNLSTTDK